jgi:Cdc6-like AAA superfamily ATPase
LPKILVLDELDFLWTRDQNVLYNVFDWPHHRKANLIIIGIANTLDLPEQLMARISSRMGNRRLVYTPYSSKQIHEIILQRIRQCDIFDDSAVMFISKKIASVSSDIRKTLSICRMAIEKWRDQQEQ